LTRSIARGFAADNILAFAVAPGFVKTEMAEVFIQESGEVAATCDIPLGNIAPPQDVAHVITFLSSGSAPHMTGTTIDINGASYMH
jgi:3-oxoacyl-[acyl-carrier protein] reductase